MNVKIFERNIKLQDLGIENLSNKEKEMLDFLNEKLGNLNTYTIKDTEYFSNLLSFGKNKDNILLYYNEKTGCLYVSYDKIWSFFESKFGMWYNEIQELIQWYVVDNQYLNIKHTFNF